jgi:hypothetical protein
LSLKKAGEEMSKLDGHSSRAYYDAKGKYHACPDNQPLAIQTEQGLTGARAHEHTFRHPLAHSSYCKKHKVLGCEAVECNQ